jgi:hypothetical protein
MININKKNFISGGENEVNIGVSKIINFLDLIGTNVVLFHSYINYHSDASQFKYRDIEELFELLEDSANTFRADVIIVDMFKDSVEDVSKVKKYLSNIGLKFIIISNNYHYVNTDKNVNIYKISEERIEGNNRGWDSYRNIYYITDMKTKDKYSFDQYVKSYVRNAKIKDIFDK